MQIKALSYTTAEPENRYLYNGKELQTDFGLNWYHYGARFYDAVIGRFPTMDAYAEKYINLTPYQYGANNPILNVDINGDSLTPAAQKWADELIEKSISQIEHNNKRIQKIKNKFYNGKISAKRYYKKQDKFNTKMSEFFQVILELDDLKESSQIYDVIVTDNLPSASEVNSPNSMYAEEGEVNYNTTTDIFEIYLSKTEGNNLGTAAHEFKHAYQFETGDLAFESNGKEHSSFLWDVYDEGDANARASLFGYPTYTPKSGKLKRQRILNSNVVLYLQRQNIIFRYNGKTYK